MLYLWGILWIGILVYFGNTAMFFFNEELIIGIALTLFLSIVVIMLRKLFLKLFFIEVKYIYVCFNFLFNLNIKLISIVWQFVNFLVFKNRSFKGEFYYSLVSSYSLYSYNQKNFLINIVDNFISDILRLFFFNILKIKRFKVSPKLLSSISALFYRLKFEKNILNSYIFIC